MHLKLHYLLRGLSKIVSKVTKSSVKCTLRVSHSGKIEYDMVTLAQIIHPDGYLSIIVLPQQTLGTIKV